jgi:hypothetical protein
VELVSKRKILTCAIFGVVGIANEATLLYAENTRKVADFLGDSVYTVTEVGSVPVSNTFGPAEPHFTAYNTKLLEVKNLMRENFFLCFTANLTCPLQAQRLKQIDLRFAWNLESMKEIVRVEGKPLEASVWFVPFVQGAIETVKVHC